MAIRQNSLAGKTFLLLCIPTCLHGCASITGSTTQPIVVRSFKSGIEFTGAACNLTNDRGNSTAVTPGVAFVRKSSGDLAVTCFKRESGVAATVVSSSSNSGLWGNVVFGGVAGAVVDASRGVGFDYPPMVTVEFIGTTPPTTAPGNQQ